MEKYFVQMIISLVWFSVIIYLLSIVKLNKKMGINETKLEAFTPWRSLYKKISVNNIFILFNDIFMMFLLLLIIFFIISILFCVIGSFLLFSAFLLLLFTLGTLNVQGMFDLGYKIIGVANVPMGIFGYLNMAFPIVLIVFLILNIYPFYKLCLSFGKSKTLSIFLSIIWPISIVILAFDKSTFVDINNN